MATRSSTERSKVRRPRPSVEPGFEVDPFHLPLPGLFADLDAGSGALALSDEFMLANPMVRARVVQHWVRSMEIEGEKAVVAAFHQFVEKAASASIVVQIEGFRGLCDREGIACPDDLPVLLQRY
jgi:hypothetical protein